HLWRGRSGLRGRVCMLWRTPLRVPPRGLDRVVFFFQAEDGIRDDLVTGVQTCALPILARLDASARASIEARLRARAAAKEDADLQARIRGAHTPIFQVWRTDADPRCFDLALDPSDRKWGTVWGNDPIASNFGSIGFGRSCTAESWLSTWSGLSSNASFEKCGAAIEQPT